MNKTELGPLTSFIEAGKINIKKQFEKMFDNLEGTVDGEDIEALHDMRVASRRLRAALRVFKNALRPNSYNKFEEQVKSVTRVLGSVRDHDVFIDYLTNFANDNPESDYLWLVEYENELREESRKNMIHSLSSINKESMEKNCRQMFAGNGKNKSFISFAPKIIGKYYDVLLDSSSAISDPSNVEGLHFMRIAAKRLRYTIEVFLPCLNSLGNYMVDDIKKLQDFLGQVHDCDVWMDKLNLLKDEMNLKGKKLTALKKLISNIQDYRTASYEGAVKQWLEMTKISFCSALTQIINNQKNKANKHI